MLNRLTLTTVHISSCHVRQKALCRYPSRQNGFTATALAGHVVPPVVGQMTSFNPPRTLHETLQVVRIPPNGRNIGPRVEHIEVAADGRLADVIATALQLPTWFALELLRFGAVHHSHIMPNPAAIVRPLMSPEHLKRVEHLIAEGRAKLGRNPKLQHPKRVLEDIPVAAGSYVRVHVHPKRFPAAYSVDWKQRILADRPDYVVVNKPAGVQVPPTVDNVLESVVCCTAVALGLPKPHSALLNTHRLDAGTSGVVVLAKNSQFAHWFSSLLRNKPDNVVKLYKCLTGKPPPVGRMVHYAVVRNRMAGEPAHTRMRRPAAAAGNTQSSGSSSSSDVTSAAAGVYCELLVLQVAEVQLNAAAAASWGSKAYETTLQLVTGRTHQIRAQMAAEGFPLLGDHLYQALAVMWQHEQQSQQHENHQCCHHGAQQEACQCSFQGGEQVAEQPSAAAPPFSEWSREYQEDPLSPIGLQAHLLRIRDVDGRMTAEGLQGHMQQQQQQQQHLQAEVKQHNFLGDFYDLCTYDRNIPHPGTSVLTTNTESEGCWVEFDAGVPWWRHNDVSIALQ